MLGRVWILNVWASWCPPCLVEHPVVTRVARAGLAPVIGLNYKDAREEALPWLERNGNPYQRGLWRAVRPKTGKHAKLAAIQELEE